jgi:hypothetical protein
MNMNCQKARNQIKVCKAQGIELDSQSSTHLASCDLCQHWQTDLALDGMIDNFAVPAPSDGFVDRVIDAAGRNVERQRRTPAFAIAAAIAVFSVALGLFLGGGEAPEVVFEVAMAPYQERLVEVVIDTTAEREQTTLTIELAESLEFPGYPNQRTIEWQTDLAAGKNLLKLPLRLNQDVDTHFNVLMNHGSNEQSMRVVVRAEPNEQGLSA